MQHLSGRLVRLGLVGVAALTFAAVAYAAVPNGTQSKEGTTPGSALVERTSIRNTAHIFYKGYLAAKTVSFSDYLTVALKQGLITAAASREIRKAVNKQHFDIATCSQNPFAADRYHFSVPKIRGSAATLKVTSPRYKSGEIVTIMLSLGKSGDYWAITKISCPR
jgi:hypothetical protein